MRLFSVALAVGGLIVTAHAQSAPAAPSSTWTDLQTKLVWTIADNGYGVTWSQAASYCRTLKLGDFKDWTLPAIDDLQHLFGGPVSQNGYHIIAPLRLTGWQWSSSPGQQRGQQWALDFGDGARASVVTGDSGLNRALCVRRTSR